MEVSTVVSADSHIWKSLGVTAGCCIEASTIRDHALFRVDELCCHASIYCEMLPSDELGALVISQEHAQFCNVSRLAHLSCNLEEEFEQITTISTTMTLIKAF